jgi:hypothetical protein
MIVYINKEYLSRCNDTLEDKAAGYTEIIVSYLLSYMINDESEYEFIFYCEFDEKIIEKTTENIRLIFPEYFIMNYLLKFNLNFVIYLLVFNLKKKIYPLNLFFIKYIYQLHDFNVNLYHLSSLIAKIFYNYCFLKYSYYI